MDRNLIHTVEMQGREGGRETWERKMYETDKREMTDGKEKRPKEKEEKEGRRDKNEERKRRTQEDANGKETRYEVI